VTFTVRPTRRLYSQVFARLTRQSKPSDATSWLWCGSHRGWISSGLERANQAGNWGEGADVSTIATGGHYVTSVAAAEMDDAGERQVVSFWPANVGTADYAVATDLEGKALWKYPVDFDGIMQMGPPILAVDVTGDGTKEWIISPNWRELVVLDTRGRLLARVEAKDKGFPAWTAIARKGKRGWIVAVEAGKLSAFSLAPKN
jgi:hypothetical protein